MNRPLVLVSSFWLILSAIACGSDPSSNGGNGGVNAGTSVGGSSANAGGKTGTTDGTSATNTGGSTGSGGTSAGNTAANVGGKTSATGGSSAVANTGGRANSGGTSARSTGGNATSDTGGKSGLGGNATGGVATSGTGGKSSAAGGTAAGDTGGKTGATGGASNGGASNGVGGSAAGGGETGGSGPSAPLLITSAQNDYFNTTHEATVVTSGTPDLTVDEATKYQRWDGFGGTFNEMGWDALSVLTETEIKNALSLLFDPDKGANLTYGRIPMAASDYSMSWFTYDDTSSPDYSMTSFSIKRDEQKLIPFIKAAFEVRTDIRLWGSPWVVPDWMKSGSSMKTDAQTQNAHALYMAKFVEEYAKQGLTIWAVHPQNEPGYGRVSWTQQGLINFMKTYLGPTFEQRQVKAEIWCGTMSKDPDDTNIALAAAKDEEAMKYIKGFGLQWNPLAAVPTLAKVAPVMQTEHRCGNYNFTTEYWNQGQYSTTKAQNDHAYGEETWQLIRDWTVAGVNSYSAWNMVLDTVGKSLDGWPQNALLVVDRSTKKLIQTPAYYAFRQYSQFVLPGATRIAATSSNSALKGISTQNWNGLNALAFKNADGSIVTEIYNKGSAAQTLVVKVGETMYQISVPAHGWDTLKVGP